MEVSLLFLHLPELQGRRCSLTAAGPALGPAGWPHRPFWSRAAQALAQDWEARGQTGSSALLLRISFIFMPYFLSPDQVSSPGKHFSSSINEDSFLLCCQWVIHVLLPSVWDLAKAF